MKNTKFEVVALGELLVDFTENGVSAQGNPLLEANPGGAPCNVLAMLQGLGHSTAFIGKVGQDSFGTMLEQAVRQQGIDTSSLIRDAAAHTTLAFVHTLPGGDREFSFYRDPGADELLQPGEVPAELVSDAKIFHFGTLSMTHPDAKASTQYALELAESAGVLRSFDPNLRIPLWANLEEARAAIHYGLAHCDILKISDNELEFMTGETDFDKGAAQLRAQYPNIRLMSATAGPGGSYAYYKDLQAFVPGFLLGGTIETTGAGDCFGASILAYLLENGLDFESVTELEQMLRFANAAAYLVTTRKGALRSMPSRAQVEEVMSLPNQGVIS